MVTKNLPPKTSKYHEPPPGVEYSTNPTVFGRILNGELPSRTLGESKRLLAFQDRSPRAKLHGLVIPKQFIPSIFDLTTNSNDHGNDQDDSDCDPDGLILLQEMRQMGLDLIEKQQPEAYANNDYILCFHIPPFNSVDHLHLHVLAPASTMGFFFRHIKYNQGTRWCISDLEVIQRLENGKSSTPYTKPQQWAGCNG